MKCIVCLWEKSSGKQKSNNQGGITILCGGCQRITFEQRLKNEDKNHKDARGEQLHIEGTVSAKALRWEHTMNALGIRRPVALKHRLGECV